MRPVLLNLALIVAVSLSLIRTSQLSSQNTLISSSLTAISSSSGNGSGMPVIETTTITCSVGTCSGLLITTSYAILTQTISAPCPSRISISTATQWSSMVITTTMSGQSTPVVINSSTPVQTFTRTYAHQAHVTGLFIYKREGGSITSSYSTIPQIASTLLPTPIETMTRTVTAGCGCRALKPKSKVCFEVDDGGNLWQLAGGLGGESYTQMAMNTQQMQQQDYYYQTMQQQQQVTGGGSQVQGQQQMNQQQMNTF